MPRFIGDLGDFFLFLLITDDESVIPAVLGDPFALFGIGKCGCELLADTGLIDDVNAQPGLVIRRARISDNPVVLAVVPLQAVGLHGFLRAITAITGMGVERNAVRLRRVEHVRERLRGNLAHLDRVGADLSAGQLHQILRHVGFIQ